MLPQHPLSRGTVNPGLLAKAFFPSEVKPGNTNDPVSFWLAGSFLFRGPERGLGKTSEGQRLMPPRGSSEFSSEPPFTFIAMAANLENFI